MYSRPVCFLVNKAFSRLTFLVMYSCLHVGYDDVVVWYSWYIVDDLTSVGFETKTRSSRFPSLVGWLWTWVRLWKLIKSVNSCCISLSGSVAVCCSHLMLGQLKSYYDWLHVFSFLIINDHYDDNLSNYYLNIAEIGFIRH